MSTYKRKLKKPGIYLDAQKAWELIENNKPIDSLYPDDWNVNYKLDPKLLLDGEEIFLYKNRLLGYCITTEGRVFHIKKGKQLSLNIYAANASITVRQRRLDIGIEIKKHFDIDVDIDILKRKYVEMGWNYYLYPHVNI